MQVATDSAFLLVGFFAKDDPTINQKRLTVATPAWDFRLRLESGFPR